MYIDNEMCLGGIIMIIWINGSFGVGKTTVANKLKEKIKKSIIYDPEEIGTFLFNTQQEKKDDFQDYELWRSLNYEKLKDLCTKFKTIIVPMTVTNKQYYDEIAGKLERDGIDVKHFVLIASKETIIKRLDARGNSTEWAYNQVDRCVSSFEKIQCDKINTDNLSSDEVVNNIIEALKK